jgi:hypothetical protein
MALSDAYDMFTDACEDILSEHTNITCQLALKAAFEAELDVLPAGDPGRVAVQNDINADRAAYRAITERWASKMDTVIAYWGTQLSQPSAYVKGNRPFRSRALLLADIRAHMAANNLSIMPRKVSYAAEPSATDNGVIDRLTVDEDGSPIAAGLHNQTVDLYVTSKPSQYASIITIKSRTKGADIFNLLGPDGELSIQAVNDAYSGDGIVGAPALNQGLSTNTNGGDLSGDTTQGPWVLTKSGSPVHTWDTSIKYRGLTGSHKMYGNSTSRTFTQPLVINNQHRRLPRNYLPAIYKTGTPVGNITVTWGNKTQVFTMAGLSAGWNYLRLDRDKDLYPRNFDTAGATLAIEFAFTSGTDSSNYINFGFMGGQVYKQFDGPFYGHWSRTGISTINLLTPAFSLADTMTSDGRNARALYFAYHRTADRVNAYLPEAASPTIADTAPPAPEIGITRNGSNVADGGTIALGTVAASTEHTVTLRVYNSGNGPLSIGVPVDVGGATNATLTTAGLSVPQAIPPQSYLDVTVGVTDGGAGAFSLTIRIDNNDASEGTYEITISGTAA